MNEERKKVLIIGVIGADVHAVGNKILYHAFTEAGFDVVNLGVMVSQEEYIEAAIEADADAIVVSSLYGQGELDCRGMREKCDEAGLAGIPLLVGGNIVVGKQDFADVESASRPWALTGPSRPVRRRKRPSPRCGRSCIPKRDRNEASIVDGFRQHLHEADCR